MKGTFIVLSFLSLLLIESNSKTQCPPVSLTDVLQQCYIFSLACKKVPLNILIHSFILKHSIRQTKLSLKNKTEFSEKKSYQEKKRLWKKIEQRKTQYTRNTNKMLLLVQWSFYKWTTLLCFNQLLGGLLIFLFILICRRPWQQRRSLWIASLIMFQLMTACTHPITHHYTRHFIFFYKHYVAP